VNTLREKDVDAVGGPGFTPLKATWIQKIIGFDLNTRFLLIPEGPVQRHPNMNLIIKKEVLVKIGFNEKYVVGYDTIFGYTLNKKGYKLWYDPKAFVWHYHRSTIFGYMKQQFFSGKYASIIFFNCKNARIGDNINSITMIIQPLIFLLILFTLVVSIFSNIFREISLILILCLFLIFTLDIVKAIKINQTFFAISLYLLYIIRLPIWLIGAIDGIVMDKKWRGNML
jgi:GT2 family glycosyltransferase